MSDKARQFNVRASASHEYLQLLDAKALTSPRSKRTGGWFSSEGATGEAGRTPAYAGPELVLSTDTPGGH